MDQTVMAYEAMKLSMLFYALREIKNDEGGTTIVS